jgi:uncharacterized protein (TIGR02466 family)
MADYNILEIFPIPILATELKREFSENELLFFEDEEKNCIKNCGNRTSKNFYVLKEASLKTLENELNLMIQDYFKIIIDPKYDTIPYFTQSWLSFTNQNEFHHSHNHPNSIVSGVLYINVDQSNDAIKFYQPFPETLYISPKNFNKYNSRSIILPVKNNLVILFPSYLQHSVEQKKENNNRISLAFNTFAKGCFGDPKDLNTLYL